ncbi:MAG: FecR family protein [Cellvibrio sp.]|uniref:FecR domain-containing protein n=1 Tax=Cellvibrio sp. TaxID=1965322 RepID=UPI0031A0D052
MMREQLLEEAADWLVRMDNRTLDQNELRALDSWCKTSPEHARIWTVACELNRQFSQLPDHFARPVLTRARSSRRTLLKSLVGAGLLIPLGALVVRNQPWQPLLAQHRTAIGERRELTLDDGSRLILNTDTALDVHVDTHQRLVRLYKGEVWVRSAADPQRSFAISSPAGTAIASSGDSAVFAIRCEADTSLLTVRRHSVSVLPASAEAENNSVLPTHQQCRFNTNGIEWTADAPTGALAWRRGELMVNRWPLEQVVAELSRYRPGILRCDADVAGISVSGVFQTAKIDQALEALAALFNLQITRITPYWVSLGAIA